MKVSYQLHEEDFLSFQMFASYKSDVLKRKTKRSRIILSVLMVVASVLFYNGGNTAMALYFACIAAVIFLFYGQYLAWRYKKHYQAYVRNNFTERFGQEVTLEITPKYIRSQDPSGEGKVKTTEVHQMSETTDHFFIQLSSGMAVIIPKSFIDVLESFKSGLKNCGISWDDDTSWKGTLKG